LTKKKQKQEKLNQFLNLKSLLQIILEPGLCVCGLPVINKMVKDQSKSTFGCHFWGCQKFPEGCNFFRWVDGKSPRTKDKKDMNVNQDEINQPLRKLCLL